MLSDQKGVNGGISPVNPHGGNSPVWDTLVLQKYIEVEGSRKFNSHYVFYNGFLFVGFDRTVQSIHFESNNILWNVDIPSSSTDRGHIQDICIFNNCVAICFYYKILLLSIFTSNVIHEVNLVGFVVKRVKNIGSYLACINDLGTMILDKENNKIKYEHNCVDVAEINDNVIFLYKHHVIIYDESFNVITQIYFPDNVQSEYVRFQSGLLYFSSYIEDEKYILVYKDTKLINIYPIHHSDQTLVIIDNYIIVGNFDGIFVCYEGKFIRKIAKLVNYLFSVNGKLYSTCYVTLTKDEFLVLDEYYGREDRLDSHQKAIISNFSSVRAYCGIHKDIGLLFCRALLI